MHQEQDFPPVPDSARAVRGFIRDALAEFADPDDVVLVASELASNVIRHARTAFTVRVTLDGSIRIEVSDGSSILPAVKDLADRSRGLRLIEAASEAWGFDLTDTGKTVWVEFPRQSADL